MAICDFLTLFDNIPRKKENLRKIIRFIMEVKEQVRFQVLNAAGQLFEK